MEDYQEFIHSVKQKLGLDLSLYKETQMKRRLTSLRNKRGYNNFTSYFLALVNHKELMDEFLDRVTINVSEFYRNYHRWEVFEKVILPKLLKKKRRLRIWSAACSTGEEPYTIAIILSKYIDLKQIQILATDIDTNVLERAKAGIYNEKALNEVPDITKRLNFTREGALYKIREDFKKCITFKQHNLLSAPFPEQFDLIVCRNVLIYFTEEAKRDIYQKVSSSLHTEGVFFVGSTEQIFNPNQYGLEVIDTFFYQKMATIAKEHK